MNSITIENGLESFICENVADLEGFEFPTTRLILTDIPARQGSLYIGALAGRRRIAWRGLITDDIYQNRKELIQVSRVGELKTIKFTGCDDVALQAEIEIDKLMMPYRIGRAIYGIEAVAPDWRFYSQLLTEESTGVTSIDGGSPIPTEIPMSLGASVSSNLFLTNEGNEVSNPILTVEGPGTNFLIQNLTNDTYVALNLTLGSGETVVIDTLNKTALKGTTNVYGAIEGSVDLLTLDPGVNEIFFNAETGSDSNTQLTVSFRSAYLGI